jgi:translation initiation factor 2 alpha subunit (eIF-2alpha)
MKSIHKFNGSLGATLCNQCSVIITTGLTDDLYCKECNKYRKELLQEIMKEDEALGLYIEQMEKEELKQETLEEFSEKVSRAFDNDNYKALMDLVKEGANWQAERMYSEEEVLEFTQTMIQQYKFGNTNIEQMDLLKESLEQFKN